MAEYALRFMVGGLVVSAFAMAGDILRPKSFAGLFSAAPSVALATLGIAVAEHGAEYAQVQSRSMILGAIALTGYSLVVCQLLMRWRMHSLPAATLALGLWCVLAFSIYFLFPGRS